MERISAGSVCFPSYPIAQLFLFSFNFFSPTRLYQIGAEGTFDTVQGVVLAIFDIRNSTFDIVSGLSSKFAFVLL